MIILKFAAKAVFYALLFLAMLLVFYKFLPVPTTITMMMDENGVDRDWVSIGDISPNLVAAVVAAEDGKFCNHNGLDEEAIKAAIENNLKGGRIRGGSTISQQTAKNVFLWQDGGYIRKGLEAVFTVAIEKIWGKRRIMEVYLNVAEMGIGTYGAEAAAQRYFKKSASALTPIEAARIAANLPQPKKRAVVNPSGFVRRYGNNIHGRIGIVKRDGLAACIYE